MTNSKSILAIATNHSELPNGHKTGLWLEEYAVPADIIKKKGYRLNLASLRGGRIPIDPRSMPESKDDPELRKALNELSETLPLNRVNTSHYDALFFPGGHGAMFDLADSRLVGDIIASFIDSGRIVAALCHGPAALLSACHSDGRPIVSGRKLTAFSNDEEVAAQLDQIMPFLLQTKLQELGANYQCLPKWSDNVVVDGNLITGQNPYSSASTALALIEVLSLA